MIAYITVVAGDIDSQGQEMSAGDTPVFNDDGETLELRSSQGGEVLLMCGEPIGEPIAIGGGFVMNTREEIERAFLDYREGKMGQLVSSRG